MSGTHAAIRANAMDERDASIASEPRLFHSAEHHRDHPAVVRLNRAPPDVIKGMLGVPSRQIATGKVVAEWDREIAGRRASRRSPRP